MIGFRQWIGSEGPSAVVLGAWQRLWQSPRVPDDPVQLEQIFRDCFFAEFRTVLEGGGSEPLYRPSVVPESSPHRVIYREDYFASALHEVAHWCIAGLERRDVEDYGYWYVPEGRDEGQQAAFERVEAKPQALEWIFSEACGFEFNLSADNLGGSAGPSDSFARAVRKEKQRYGVGPLPDRAHRFREALVRWAEGSVFRSAGLIALEDEADHLTIRR